MQTVRKKFGTRRVFGILALSLFALAFIGASTVAVDAAAKITPSSGTVMVGLPQQFTVTGLNASRSYTIEVDGVATTTSISPSSDGTLIFSYTFTEAGNHVVKILDEDDGNNNVATGSYFAMDILNYIVGFLMIVFMIIIVIRIFNRAGNII